MLRPGIRSFLTKTAPAFLFFLTFFIKPILAQERVDTPLQYIVTYPAHIESKPFPVTGRLVGMNLEILKGALATDICTGESVKTDDNGFFHLNAAKGDTLGFCYGRYSVTMVPVKTSKEHYNVVLMKRKTDGLPQPYTHSEYDKAKKEDEDMYKILDKDAKLEGRWNY